MSVQTPTLKLHTKTFREVNCRRQQKEHAGIQTGAEIGKQEERPQGSSGDREKDRRLINYQTEERWEPGGTTGSSPSFVTHPGRRGSWCAFIEQCPLLMDIYCPCRGDGDNGGWDVNSILFYVSCSPLLVLVPPNLSIASVMHVRVNITKS